MSDTQQAFSNLIDIFGNAEADRLKKKQLEEDRAYRNAQTLENNRRWDITNDRAVANQKVVDDERNRQEAIRNASLTHGSYGALVGDRTRTNLLDAQDQLAVKAGYKPADHGGMTYSEYIASPYKATEKDALKLEMDRRANGLKDIESKMWGTNLQNDVQGEFKGPYPTSKNEGINDIRKYIERYNDNGDIGKKLNDVDYGKTYDYDSTFNYNVNKLMGAGASASEAANQVKAYMGPKPVTNTSESYKRTKNTADNAYNTAKTALDAQYKNDLNQSGYEDKINNMDTKKMLMTEYPDINKSSWSTKDNPNDGESTLDTSLESLLTKPVKGLVDKDGNKLTPLTIDKAVKTGLITNADIKRELSNNMDTVSAGGRDISYEGVNDLVNLIKARAKLSEDKLKKATMSRSQELTDKYKSDLTKLENMRTATLNNSTNTPKPISDSERVDKLFKDIKPYSEQTPKTVLGESSNSGKDSKQIGSNENGSGGAGTIEDFDKFDNNSRIPDPIEQNIVKSKIQSIADITNTKDRSKALKKELDNIKDPAGKRDFANNVANLLAYKRDKLNLKRILEQKPTTEEGNIRRSIDYLEAQLSANRHNSNLSPEVKKDSSKKIEDSINALKLKLSAYSNTKDKP